MKIRHAALVTTFATLALPATAAAYTPGVAYTRVSSIGKTNSGTGNTAAPAINAEVATVDNGVSINSTGVGTGFQKQGLYVSVLYENGSKSTGPGACLPNGKVPFGDRIIGAWVPDGSTHRVLAPVTELGQAYAGGHLVGSWDKGTISVRRVDLIKPPILYANLQACGRVQTVSTPTPTLSNLWQNSLSTIDGLTASKLPSIPTLRSVLATPVNPIAPGLLTTQPPTSVAAPAPIRAAGVVTQTQTVTTPATTVKTPATTVTVPKVVTVTAPAVTVTAPAVTVTIPGVGPLSKRTGQ